MANAEDFDDEADYDEGGEEETDLEIDDLGTDIDDELPEATLDDDDEEEIASLDELAEEEDQDDDDEEDEDTEEPTETEEDEDEEPLAALDEDEDEEEAEESLDVLLGADEAGPPRKRRRRGATDTLDTTTNPAGEGEFTCRSCFLVKRRAQLADADQLICVDCA